MKYEKANAEIVRFDGLGLFMNGSPIDQAWIEKYTAIRNAFAGCNGITGPDPESGNVTCPEFDAGYSFINVGNGIMYYKWSADTNTWQCDRFKNQ